MPFTVGGLQPYAEPSIKGPWDGTPQVGLTGGVTISHGVIVTPSRNLFKPSHGPTGIIGSHLDQEL